MISMLNRTLLLSAAVAVAASTSPAGAQTPQAERIPAQLTLEDALRLAHAHNPGFLQTNNDDDVAQASVRSAYGRFLPSVSGSMGVGGSQTHTVTYLNPITQRPERLDDPQTTSGSGLNQNVSVSMTVFDGGASFKNLDVQKTNARNAETNILIQRNALDAAVRNGYFQALRSTQNIALSEQLLASAQQRLAQTEALYRMASRQTVDVLGAKASVAEQQMALEAAKNDAIKGRLALARTMGIASDGEYQLVGSVPDIYDPARLHVDSLVAIARRLNPVLARQQILATIAEKQVGIANASRLPSIGASFGFGRSVSVPNYSAYKYLNPQNSSMSFGLSMSLPIFSQFSKSASVASARAAAEDANLALTDVALQIETDVRTAYIDFTNAYHASQLADLRASLSNERLALSQDQYQRGTITFAELQQIIDAATSAQRAALDARFGWISALINLEQRVGAPIAN
jgi:outer membrane protein